MSDISTRRHSMAHVLATAILKLYPDTKLGIGPSIEDGLYYDFEFSFKFNEENFQKIKDEMLNIIKSGVSFEKGDWTIAEAKEIMQGQPYKVDLINELESLNEKPTFYKSGEFTDLCAGPHVESMSELSNIAFEIDRVAGAYWRGDEKNKMMTRIYVLCFDNQVELDEFKKRRQEAEERDHRKLGKELDLFVFSDVIGKGLPLWTERGATIRRELERFIVDEEIARGYKHVYTPDIAKLDLYKKSGHYPYYKESMYAPITIDDEEFMLRPMTCPHHFELYLSKKRSYKELPMRIAELAKLYRYEQSGELTGLIRVRGFCLADAHIICRDSDQAGQEVNGALDLIEHICSVFGLKMGENYSYRLSLGNREDGSKYYKDDAAWESAEAELRKILLARGSKFIEAKDEAAFYGPKIDIQMRDVKGKENTAFTVQWDFVMPKRFALTYTNSEGNDQEALVVHRSSIGAIERVFAFLIEHFAGNLPVWLAPEHVKILAISSDKHSDYVNSVALKMKQAGIRVEVDLDNETLGNKIRKATSMKVPYVVVVGDKEMESNILNIRVRGQKDTVNVNVDDLISKIKEKISTKSLDIVL